MKPSTIALFNTRYEEGYDIEDEFYSIWSKLKTLSIGNKSPLNSSTELSPASSKESAEATPLLDEILTYPDPMKAKVKKGKSTSNMPKHLTGEQMIQYLENKRLEKERLEEEKIKRQEEREQNRRKREEEKERKKEERERKRVEREQKKRDKDLKKNASTGRGGRRGRGGGSGSGRGRGRGRGSRIGGQRGQGTECDSNTPCARESSTDVSSGSESDDVYVCDVCGMCGGGDWIACDSCNIWYHQECVDVAGDNLEEIEWLCNNCET